MPDKNIYRTFDQRLKNQIEECLDGLNMNNQALQKLLCLVNETYGDFQSIKSVSERHYRSIIEHSSDILYKSSAAGYFTYVNPAAERITGYSEAELLGKHFSELIKPAYREAAVNFYREQFAARKASTYYEFPVLTKHGGDRWVGQSVQLTQSDDGKIEFTALVIDITERKTYEEQIVRQKEKYLNIITNMNLGMIEVDLEERILFANHTFFFISGYSQQELIGKKASELLVLNDNRSVLREKMAMREKGLSDMYEIQVKNKKGETRWWVVSGAPNYDAQGKIIGSIGIHLDITEKKQMEMELEAARLQSEESSRAKAAFLAHMSHEIRTPLNGIIGMVRELTYEPLSKKQQEYVDNAATASEHLLSVLNNVLDISKVEAGELSLERRHFKLKDTIKEVKAMMKLKAREKGLYFGLDVMDVTNMAYIGDPARIRQVLLNLIGNAIKFTEQGGVYVECKIKTKGNGGHTIALSVEDTGIGMEASFQQKLFRKFSQEDASTSRKYGGTGLGMAISYEIIKLMQGSVSVSSKKNEGTRIEVLFDLPLGQPDKVDRESGAANPAMNGTTRVLLVEDNAFNRAVACNTLRRYACDVTEAVNGREAVQLLKKNRFDVVLMDLQMPVMDGFEATRIIRQQLQLDVPIIALTANAFKSELEQCLTEGMNDYMTKPFEEKALMSLVKQFRIKNKAAVTKEPPLAIEQDKLYDLTQLTKMSGGDTVFIQQMIQLFMEQALLSMQQINEAYSRLDLHAVYAVAHRLKPSIDSLAIKTLQGPIRMLEEKAMSGIDSPEIQEQINLLTATIHQVVERLKSELH